MVSERFLKGKVNVTLDRSDDPDPFLFENVLIDVPFNGLSLLGDHIAVHEQVIHHFSLRKFQCHAVPVLPYSFQIPVPVHR